MHDLYTPYLRDFHYTLLYMTLIYNLVNTAFSLMEEREKANHYLGVPFIPTLRNLITNIMYSKNTEYTYKRP